MEALRIQRWIRQVLKELSLVVAVVMGGGAGRREGAYGVGEGWGMRLDRKVEKLNIW